MRIIDDKMRIMITMHLFIKFFGYKKKYNIKICNNNSIYKFIQYISKK